MRTLAIDGATIDVLVNNAGISSRGSCKSTKIDVHRQLMEVNYFGTIALTRLLLDAIPKNGAIVIIGSLQSRVALPYRSAYSASKHANQVINCCCCFHFSIKLFFLRHFLIHYAPKNIILTYKY